MNPHFVFIPLHVVFFIRTPTFQLLISNLLVNNYKTEHTVIERGDKNTMMQYQKIMGSLLGDVEDLAYRKHSAIAEMTEIMKIWIRKYLITKFRRLEL